MKTAVILASGKGTKAWPYNGVRSKTMIPVSNKPVIAYSIDCLTANGFDNITVVASDFAQGIKNYFRKYENVRVVEEKEPQGTAFSLLKAREYVEEDTFLALYGDTIIDGADLIKLINCSGCAPAALVQKHTDRPIQYVGCTLDGDRINCILGHSRDDTTHHFCGFVLDRGIFDELECNSGLFTSTDVGIMPPKEGYLEMTLCDMMNDGVKITAVEPENEVFDIDRPWDVLKANYVINQRRCSALTQNVLAEGASIDESADINGFVVLGKNSSIGKNVTINGNIIVGDNTTITCGAIIHGDTVIGNGCRIRNYCFVESGTTIGNGCIVSHAAELSGLIMDNVFLYHYMEIYGLIGCNVDFGAATVCGTLRFDDGITVHNVKGRKETDPLFGDACFIGDYSRTGVNAVIMPGSKVGIYSIIGAGVLLNRDVPDNTLIYNEQNLVAKKWGPEKYGW